MDKRNFSERMRNKIVTPFDNEQSGRPLQITFHNSALKALTESEKLALDVLYEFSRVKSPHLFAMATEPGDLLFLEIEQQLNKDHISVKVRYSKDQFSEYGIMYPNRLPDLAALMVKRLGEDAINNEQALNDLIIAKAHRSAGQDILVTSSKWLLENREIGFVKDTNPCIPSEALKILGLLFRTRDDFRYAGRASFDRGLFYWILTRCKLPAMWRYFSACVYSEEFRKDDTLILGQSILVRCKRAIQARDEIGRLFYVQQNNDVSDEALYHFDYLTLLLLGALDAQARIAYRTYKITKPKSEYSVSFRRREDFIEMLALADSELASFISSDHFRDVCELLALLRNTIHGAGLTTMAYQDGIAPQKSYIRIPDPDKQVIWDICEKSGSAQNWGLLKLHNFVVFEPYAFSQKLLDCVIEIVNKIASLTQVEKLFPPDIPIPELKNGPPDNDKNYNPRICERLSLLA